MAKHWVEFANALALTFGPSQTVFGPGGKFLTRGRRSEPSNMPNRSWIFALVCAWFCGVCSGASTPAGSGRYNIEQWTTEEGLKENTVIAMTQTRDGYLWLGLFNGSLVRFDGLNFTPFDESNTPGLDNSPIVYLFEDSRSNLWVGTATSGVVLIKNGQVIPQSAIGRSREGRLMSACEDAAGGVWLYTADGQLFRERDGQMEQGKIPTLGGRSSCRAMVTEKSGLVWVGTDWQMFGINPNPGAGKNFLEQVLPVTNRLDFLLASKAGGYWRFAGGEIEKWTGEHFDQSYGHYPWNPALTRINCACEDHAGNLVVGTAGEGIWLIDATGKIEPSHISGAQGLSSDTILSVCVDQQDSLWVGTDGRGLNRVTRQVFAVVPETQGITCNRFAKTIRAACCSANSAAA